MGEGDLTLISPHQLLPYPQRDLHTGLWAAEVERQVNRVLDISDTKGHFVGWGGASPSQSGLYSVKAPARGSAPFMVGVSPEHHRHVGMNLQVGAVGKKWDGCRDVFQPRNAPLLGERG